MFLSYLRHKILLIFLDCFQNVAFKQCCNENDSLQKCVFICDEIFHCFSCLNYSKSKTAKIKWFTLGIYLFPLFYFDSVN